jgi:hypothetical protein
MRKFARAATLASSIIVTGCATIVGDPDQLLPINSTPDDASIVVTDETGVEVFKGTTPTTVTLQKSDGSYFGGKEYTVQISKSGFESQQIPIRSKVNGWYIGGNLIFGGLIGYLIVDPLNGNMYTLTPEAVASSLGQSTAHNNNRNDGGISVILLSDVPQDLLTHLQPLH